MTVNGSDLNMRANSPTTLQAGQVLTTRDGKAEVLLSPGVFLRVGRNSEIRMVSPGLVSPQFELTRGEAMVEVDQKLRDARVGVILHGANGSILKEGLYRFDADKGLMEVVDGKLSVMEDGRSKEIGKGKELVLNSGPALQIAGFDRKAEDELYAWSRIRSSYMAEVNASTASYIYGGYGPFAGNGWYWSPYFASWSWLPGDGYFYGPFGYPFFSPAYAVYAPYYRGGFGGRGYYGGGLAARGGLAAGHASGMVAGGGFRGGGGGGRR